MGLDITACRCHMEKCPHCGSDDTYLVTGDEMRIKDIEVIG